MYIAGGRVRTEHERQVMWRTGGHRVVLCGIVALLGTLALGGTEVPEGVQPGGEESAAAVEATQGKPRIEFGNLVHDFGRQPSGTDLATVFEFKNVGDDVLVVQKVKGG
jgi:hypothetical protein